ncbi:hypothetical protein NG798_24245 [Ancylothrix sp. C2]|uniref:hypothetical protein n=1 Tax=Ancylothrix sp. D3o TaxID=2953691 RepID=UPI0021BA8F88|nr:hypothetical protein [Ancylothrix sp. D3o]MCT7952915.1 hypothetical protein [Ancylothrix sp. D3o]
MKKIIETILASSAVFTTFCLSLSPSQAQSLTPVVKQSKNYCDTAVENVKAKIKNNNYLTVEFQGRQIYREWQVGAPAGRSIHLIILLGTLREGSGQLVDNIMASTQMLTAMSNQLIEGCDNIAAVTYSKKRTGSIRTFGSIQGRVQEFEYMYTGRGKPFPGQPLQLRWGVDIMI